MIGDDTGIDSEAELRAELTALFRRAHDQGVDVLGGWECSEAHGSPEWDVVVTEVRRSNGED